MNKEEAIEIIMEMLIEAEEKQSSGYCISSFDVSSNFYYNYVDRLLECPRLSSL